MSTKNLLPTPYFQIDEAALEKDIRLLKQSLQDNWNNYIVGYSVKTNSLPWLLKKFQENGFHAEIVSQDEYELVTRLGFTDGELVYNGPIKSKETFLAVIQHGGIVNIDSTREVTWIEELSRECPDQMLNLGIRVNFDLDKECPNATAMKSIGGRFGYCYEDGTLAGIIAKLKSLGNVTIAGLHMHTTSQTRAIKVYETIAAMACTVAREFHLSLQYVDMGGGYFGGVADKPSFPEYMKAIAAILSTQFFPEETLLVVEPGISLISTATTFVSTVIDVKDVRGHRYLVTDGSRTNVDPVMNRNWYYHHFEKIDQEQRAILPKQIVGGFTCLDHDRIFEIHDGEELKIGDRIVYENVGGYTMALNPLFIRYFPTIYIKKKSGDYFVAREKWTAEQYLQNYHY